MSNDWSIYKMLGASNHTGKERESNDYYATDPIAIDRLEMKFDIPHNVWEPCCGEGHLSKRLIELGHDVYSSDLIDRGFGHVANFFETMTAPTELGNNFCILTNPPYKYACDAVKHSLDLVSCGCYVIMFLKTTFLEGKKRHDELFSKTPPKYIFQFVSRLLCAKNGDFDYMRAHGGSAVSYAWYIWKKEDYGATIIDWI